MIETIVVIGCNRLIDSLLPYSLPLCAFIVNHLLFNHITLLSRSEFLQQIMAFFVNMLMKLGSKYG